jgi:lipopolysaccharide transport system ATP-binding protein
MSDFAIRVEGLSKQYRIGGPRARYRTIRESLTSAVLGPFRRLRSLAGREARGASGRSETIWALKDIAFQVEAGEVVGIIGRNGAGKTTLLKLLSRITEPTEGYAEIRGRVGSLLEVGTGFHPELTGRENIYLNGAILGMRRSEIGRKFDEIVAFSEIEKFLDTPVKHYSSGMYVRLAFAVAAHLEPEILLIDEVLAVGDAAFQRKCLGKMEDVARGGRTVLFVSHNMQAIRSLCHRSSLLESGRLVFSGTAGECIDRYVLDASKDIPSEVDTTPLRRSPSASDSSLRIVRVGINGENGRALISASQPLEVEMAFRCSERLEEVVLGISIHTMDNFRVLECRSTDTYAPISVLTPGEYRVKCAIADNILSPGIYSLAVGARCASKGLDYVPNAMAFEVLSTERYDSLWLEAPSGVVRIQSEWTAPHPSTPEGRAVQGRPQ